MRLMAPKKKKKNKDNKLRQTWNTQKKLKPIFFYIPTIILSTVNQSLSSTHTAHYVFKSES